MTAAENPLDVLRDLLRNEPEAGLDHKRDMDWCVDCAEFIAEYGSAVEQLVEAARGLTFAVWENDWEEQQAADRFREALARFPVPAVRSREQQEPQA